MHDGRAVVGLKLENLGRTSAPSTLTYLDNGVVFVGSRSGDSQARRAAPALPAKGAWLAWRSVLTSWKGMRCLLDMTLVGWCCRFSRQRCCAVCPWGL